MKAKSIGGPSGGRLRSAMRMLSVVCLLVFATGCAHDVTYLRESERAVHLTKGEAAPHDGWLLSDDHLAELYDLLEQKLAEEDLPGK